MPASRTDLLSVTRTLLRWGFYIDIGWLMLTISIVVTTALSLALRGRIAFPPVSFSAVLTVLMIFVLARIFETGSRMRTELQETI